MNNLVSIIIPCYNDADFIEQAVNSAINQTYLNKEIIVVDDGSNQQTKLILKSLESKVDILLTQENKGPSAARNYGISKAAGDYILVLDSDDYFEPKFCEKAIDIIQNNSSIRNVTCYARWFWNDSDYKIFRPEGGGIEKFLLFNASLASSLFLKKDILSIDGYDEQMINGYEDWEYFIRLHKLGGETFVIPEVLFHYRKKHSSRSSEAHKFKYHLIEYIYDKHSELYKQHFGIFLRHLLETLQMKEEYTVKIKNSIDYRIGKGLLKPFRSIKHFFRK